MFSDKVIIFVKAGSGGDGAISFRRERHIPKGGPDGGDGGKGGDVYIEVDSHTKTLIQLYRKPHCKAEHGDHGKGQKKNGKDGQDLIIKVPAGTVVEDLEKERIIADLAEPERKILIAKGGSGGKGNYRFRNSQRQTPRFAQKGEKGEELKLKLNLKLIADAGLVGFPNAGKSTLLSRVSAAKPKIADYPFTTMEPYLGVVKVDEENSFVLADIPGIIEGAHQGVGLGTRFLKHIERTKVLIHIIDGAKSINQGIDDIYNDYLIIENELKNYAQILEKKEKIIAVNKCDLPEVQSRKKEIKEYFLKKGIPVFFISAVSGEGISDLIYQVFNRISFFDSQEKEEQSSQQQEKEEISYYKYEPDFTVKKQGGLFIVEGSKIVKLVNQFDLENPQALEYFQKKFKSSGVEKVLLKEGITDGDKVKIGEKTFYFYS